MKVLQIKCIVLDLAPITLADFPVPDFELENDDCFLHHENRVDPTAEAQQRVFEKQTTIRWQIDRGVVQDLDLLAPGDYLALAVGGMALYKSRRKGA